MTKDRDAITITVTEDDIVGGDNRVVDLIKSLQDALAKVPEEHRANATLEIWAYDWEGSAVTYERPLTDEEKAERLRVIEEQRAKVGGKIPDEWLRNVRMNSEFSRAEAEEYIRTNPEANSFHPDVYVKPRIATDDDDPRPWARPA